MPANWPGGGPGARACWIADAAGGTSARRSAGAACPCWPAGVCPEAALPMHLPCCNTPLQPQKTVDCSRYPGIDCEYALPTGQTLPHVIEACNSYYARDASSYGTDCKAFTTSGQLKVRGCQNLVSYTRLALRLVLCACAATGPLEAHRNASIGASCSGAHSSLAPSCPLRLCLAPSYTCPL